MSEDSLRRAIIGALNLLDAHSPNTILGTLPAGGDEVERMCERLRDHLRAAIGLTEPGFFGVMENGDGPPIPMDADEYAARWLAKTDEVIR